MEEIKVGDVVVLKSGGPKMTVAALAAKIVCIWFVDGELKENYFFAPTLKVVREEGGKGSLTSQLA